MQSVGLQGRETKLITRLLQLAGLLILISAGGLKAQDADLAARAHRLFYSAGVLQNCQALTEEYMHRFETAADALGLSPAQLADARRSGLNRADWQWGNRGLGGYRRWCAGEGALAADWAQRLAFDVAAPAPAMDDGSP